MRTCVIALTLLVATACESAERRGRDVYNVKCIVCHGPTGAGEPETQIEGAQDLSVQIPSFTDEQILDTIDNGTVDDGDGINMDPVLATSAEKADLIVYLRATFP